MLVGEARPSQCCNGGKDDERGIEENKARLSKKSVV